MLRVQYASYNQIILYVVSTEDKCIHAVSYHVHLKFSVLRLFHFPIFLLCWGGQGCNGNIYFLWEVGAHACEIKHVTNGTGTWVLGYKVCKIFNALSLLVKSTSIFCF